MLVKVIRMLRIYALLRPQVAVPRALVNCLLLLLKLLKYFIVVLVGSIFPLIDNRLLVFQLLVDWRRSKHGLLSGRFELVHLPRHHLPSLVWGDRPFLISVLLVPWRPAALFGRGSILMLPPRRHFGLLRLVLLNVINGKRFRPGSFFEMVSCILRPLPLSVLLVF